MSSSQQRFVGVSPRQGKDEQVRRSRRLDTTDKQIVVSLQIDGRLSYRELARQVGASESAVRNRVARLRREGVIQIVAVTDPLALGFSHEALIAVRCASNSDRLADELAAIEAVDFLVQVCGKFDLLLEVVAGSDEELLALLQVLRAIVAPGELVVLPYLKTWMQEYAWGVR